MNLRETILEEHSKKQTDKIVSWVGSSQARFDELFSLFITNEYRVAQRAAWPLSYIVIEHPSLIRKHFGTLLNNLKKPGIHDAVKRNTVRLLQDISIPKRYHGQVMDTCFEYISSPAEPAAIKAFSLTVLSNLSKEYPDIIPEIKLIIEEYYDKETAAFKVRAKRFLSSLKKHQK